MPSYREDVKGGVSVIRCLECGEVVVAELRHEREHVERAARAETVTDVT